MTAVKPQRRVVATKVPDEEPAVEEEVEEEAPEEDEPDEAEEAPEEPDPNDELWPGGPKWAAILEWKEEFGENNIYVTSLTPTYHVVWRTLTRFEYRRLIKNMEQAVASGQVSQSEANLNNEESISEICCLFPKYNRANAIKEQAGLPTAIAQEVMEQSAFVPIDVRRL